MRSALSRLAGRVRSAFSRRSSSASAARTSIS